MVVTPMEVVKIRLQAQQHSLADPLEAPRYRNAGHAVYAIVREEGFSALYRGVYPTTVRGIVLSVSQICSYDQAKQVLKRRGLMQEGVGLHFAASMFAG